MLQSVAREPFNHPPATPSLASLRETLGQTREAVLARLRQNLSAFGDRFPAETCVKGYYPLTDNVE